MSDEVVYTRGTPEFREVVDRRRLPEGAPRKSFEAKQMLDIYQEIARRLVLGQKNVQIANDLNVTKEMVSYVRNSDIVKRQTKHLHEESNKRTVDIATRIKGLAPHAMNLLEDIIVLGQVGEEKLPAKLRAHHAEAILDRAGYAPPKEIRSMNLHGHYTSEDIERIKARALGRAQEQQEVIEVLAVEEDEED